MVVCITNKIFVMHIPNAARSSRRKSLERLNGEARLRRSGYRLLQVRCKKADLGPLEKGCDTRFMLRRHVLILLIRAGNFNERLVATGLVIIEAVFPCKMGYDKVIVRKSVITLRQQSPENGTMWPGVNRVEHTCQACSPTGKCSDSGY